MPVRLTKEDREWRLRWVLAGLDGWFSIEDARQAARNAPEQYQMNPTYDFVQTTLLAWFEEGLLERKSEGKLLYRWAPSGAGYPSEEEGDG